MLYIFFVLAVVILLTSKKLYCFRHLMSRSCRKLTEIWHFVRKRKEFFNTHHDEFSSLLLFFCVLK